MASAEKAAAAQQYPRHPFQFSVNELTSHVGTDIDSGLSSAKVPELRTKYGENVLAGEGGVKWYAVLMKQISNAMILVSLTFSTSTAHLLRNGQPSRGR